MADTVFSPVPQDEEGAGHRLSRRVKIWLIVGVVLLLVVVTVCAVVGVVLWKRRNHSWSGPPSTANFSQILGARCFSYSRDSQVTVGPKNCDKIIDAFLGAFLSKDPCGITEDDYEPLIKLTRQSIPCNKVLLWSKTKEAAHKFTQQRPDLFTLEDTLLGYLANDLMWCGFPNSDELNYASCPDSTDCMGNAQSVFWDVASKTFARGACGVVNVLLNGSISAPFDNSSTFGRVELYSLPVKELQVWLLDDKEGTSSVSCKNESIKNLEEVAGKRNMTVTCQHVRSLDEIHI